MSAAPAHLRPQGKACGVADLVQLRINRALAHRVRYKYVRPRVEAWAVAGQQGWKIVSPNCSRQIDPAGGEIDIAWLVQDGERRWVAHARDHARGGWRAMDGGLSLEALLARVCADPLRVYWV